MQVLEQQRITYPKNSPEYFKLYYERKKEQILNRLNEKIVCSCGCEVAKVHLQRHYRTHKHQRSL